jgi:hypothetical protein
MCFLAPSRMCFGRFKNNSSTCMQKVYMKNDTIEFKSILKVHKGYTQKIHYYKVFSSNIITKMTIKSNSFV